MNIKYLLAFIFIVFAYIACNKEDKNKDCRDIVISDIIDGNPNTIEISGPIWFQNVIDSIAKSVAEGEWMRSFSVYYHIYEKQDYIIFINWASSAANHQYYTCMGVELSRTPIFEPSLYWDVNDSFFQEKVENRILLGRIIFGRNDVTIIFNK